MAKKLVGRETITHEMRSFGGSPYGTIPWSIPKIREIFISILQFYVYFYVFLKTLLSLGKFTSPYLMKYGIRELREQGNNELTVFKQENGLNSEQIQILLDLVTERKQRALTTQRAGLEIESEEDSNRPCPHKFKKTLARPSVAESEL